MSNEMSVQSLRAAVATILSGGGLGSAADYRVGPCFKGAYTAVSKLGAVALLMPLSEEPSGLARSFAGFSLLPVRSMDFQWDGKEWSEPVAVLECTEPKVLEQFLILAEDVTTRATRSGKPRWQKVIQVVEEWQRLLAKRRVLSMEAELGLWAELLVLKGMEFRQEVLEGWRGPEGEVFDFLVGGIAIEVKASRRRLVHQFSQRQVEHPGKMLNSFAITTWVTVDPVRGQTLSDLVAEAFQAVVERAPLLRGLSDAGYSFADAAEYRTRFLLLELHWFATGEIPRVRKADLGVKNIRFEVELDAKAAVPENARPDGWSSLGRLACRETEQ